MQATTSRTRRTAVSRLTSAIAGVLLILLTVQPAAALTWSGESQLTTQSNYQPRILRTGASSAISIWQAGVNAYARRTTDGGKTWTAQKTIATGVFLNIGASSSGSTVDIVYVRASRNANGSIAHRLFYRRSVNGGATWQAARALTSTSSHIGDATVARHANGQVSVAWTGLYSGNIHMRSSTDGGTTFGAAKFVTRTNNSEVGRRVTYRGDVQLAIGTGVTYIAYTSGHDVASIRRSLNRGTSWSAAVKLGTTASPEYSLAASGSSAVVGYTVSGGLMKAFYRRTTNKGGSWSVAKAIVSVPAGSFSMMPQFTYRAGVLAVVYKFGPPGASPIWIQQSTNFGGTWSARTKVSVVHFTDSDPEPGGVALLDRTTLAGYNENRRSPDEGYWVRRSR